MFPASASLDLHYHSSNVNDDITRQLASLHHPNSAAECKRCFKVSFPHARSQVTSLPHTLIINYTNPRPWATRVPLTDVATEVDPPPAVLPSQALAPETKQNYALHSAVVALTAEPSRFASLVLRQHKWYLVDSTTCSATELNGDALLSYSVHLLLYTLSIDHDKGPFAPGFSSHLPTPPNCAPTLQPPPSDSTTYSSTLPSSSSAVPAAPIEHPKCGVSPAHTRQPVLDNELLRQYAILGHYNGYAYDPQPIDVVANTLYDEADAMTKHMLTSLFPDLIPPSKKPAVVDTQPRRQRSDDPPPPPPPSLGYSFLVDKWHKLVVKGRCVTSSWGSHLASFQKLFALVTRCIHRTLRGRAAMIHRKTGINCWWAVKSSAEATEALPTHAHSMSTHDCVGMYDSISHHGPDGLIERLRSAAKKAGAFYIQERVTEDNERMALLKSQGKACRRQVSPNSVLGFAIRVEATGDPFCPAKPACYFTTLNRTQAGNDGCTTSSYTARTPTERQGHRPEFPTYEVLHMTLKYFCETVNRLQYRPISVLRSGNFSLP